MIELKNLSKEQMLELAETFLSNGRAMERNVREEDVDPEELNAGIVVEYEHSGGKTPMAKEIAKRIALDHLAEIPDYYTRLKKMEKDAGVTEDEEVKKIAEQIERQQKSTCWKTGTMFPGN